MSPTSSTTTRSQRPLKSSSKSLPATAGPRTCMTGKSVTTPSAERSLHHCSLKSESSPVGHGTGRPVVEQFDSQISSVHDVTIGQTLLDACRRRADHSEEECLSSCLSSSVSHDRTVKPVVCRLVSSAQETQRHNSENEQIRILLERQRGQILADRQAEIRKHEFLADCDRRNIQKLNGVIESQRGD